MYMSSVSSGTSLWRDTVGIQWRYSEGTVGVQWGHSRGTVRVQWGYSEDTVEIQSVTLLILRSGISLKKESRLDPLSQDDGSTVRL